MKKLTIRLLFGFMGLATLASMVGAISGTVAWYAYVTRATMSYSGTSVNSTKQLQIGIKSDIAVTFPNGTITVDLPYGDGGHYYFMNPGAMLPASVISAYLDAKGYTTTTLEPVSSYTYTTGDAINLRNAPIANKPFETRTNAEITKYVEIPFALRILESDLLTPTYVSSKPIYITDAQAQAASSGDGEVYKAIRMFIDRSNGSDFILNPTSETDGQTKVAGVLDISGDDLFDYINDMSSPYYGCECLYGDFDLPGDPTPTPGTDAYVTAYKNLLSEPLQATSGLVDINGSSVTDHRTTFTAKHYEGIKYFNNLNSITPHYAQYLGTNTVFPKPNAQGELENNYAVCVTANNTQDNRYCIGEFNIKIYLEGWDFNVIDEELEHSFNLGLTFEIN